jgi:hypothetical protein
MLTAIWRSGYVHIMPIPPPHCKRRLARCPQRRVKFSKNFSGLPDHVALLRIPIRFLSKKLT